ncbi:MAG TPA: MFS transporter [Pseudonocardiaceae bacterium]|jgi:MFS family permease|nr:MFS transporter [Pseudonocardiaceae bacterium]
MTISTEGAHTAATGLRQADPATDGSNRSGLSSAGLITLLLGAALPIIDFFIVNVALPTIDTTLHASTSTLELVVAGYGIAYAVLLVLGGRLGDTFGRRRLFIAGLAAFTVTSLACGLAPTATVLVLARAFQGAAAALMLPQVLSTIQATTSGQRRSAALGFYGATGGICTVVGQLLGGLLVAANIDGSQWRPIFLVNVPVGLAGLLLASRTVPDTRSENPVGIDRLGTVLLGVSLLTLLVPLMEGGALGWPVWIWLTLGVFPFAAAGFVVVERRSERAGAVPLLPPSVMRLPSMRKGLLLAAPFFAAFGGFMFVYAVTLQEGLHLGPLGSGVALTPLALGFLGASLLSSRLVTRLGSRVVPYGATIQGLGIAVLIGSTLLNWPDLGVLDLAPGMVLIGVGQGMTMTTLFRVILSQVPVDRAGVGSGALVTTQQTCLALGVATLGTLYASLGTPSGLGMRDAFVLVMAVMFVVAVALSIGGRALPDPRG